jgi:hypothetical protein
MSCVILCLKITFESSAILHPMVSFSRLVCKAFFEHISHDARCICSFSLLCNSVSSFLSLPICCSYVVGSEISINLTIGSSPIPFSLTWNTGRKKRILMMDCWSYFLFSYLFSFIRTSFWSLVKIDHSHHGL